MVFFLVCLEKEIAKFPKMCYTATCTSNERTKDNIMTVQHKQAFWKGVRQGIPIALGYLSVSFSIGILAVKAGLSVSAAVAISMTNVTSAGQAAGIGVIAAGGSYLELALTQFCINLRYALMGLSLSQKLDQTFQHIIHRFLTAFGITDEIFAVAVSQDGQISAPYLYGLMSLPLIGWSLGTFLGAAAGEILPKIITDALGIALYGMFFAIFIPPMRKQKSIVFAVLVAAGCSIICKYCLPFISSGFAIILCGVLTAALCAWLFPRKEEQGAAV